MCCTYLHEIDNGESVGDTRSCVGEAEVEPLRVFVRVQIVPQPQVVRELVSVKFRLNVKIQHSVVFQTNHIIVSCSM